MISERLRPLVGRACAAGVLCCGLLAPALGEDAAVPPASRPAATAPTAASGAAPPALTAPQPWRFTVDSLAIDLRVDLAQDGPRLARPDHRLGLCASLPMDAAVLSLTDIAFAPVTTDGGERLGLLLRPNLRTQTFTLDHAFNRDRQVKLALDLTPPWRTCTRLSGLSGRVTMTVASGRRQQGTMRTTIGSVIQASNRGGAIGSATLTDRSPKAFTLVLSRALADRLPTFTARDADDQELPSKAKEVSRAQGVATFSLELATERCERIVVSWFPELEDRRVEIAIATIDVPGGIPGIGALGEAPPSAAPAPAGKPVALKSPLHLAIAAGDLAEVERLLDADPHANPHVDADREAPDADGRRPLQRAVALGQAEIARALIARKVDVDARARDGSTALQLAAGNIGMTTLLIASGATVGAAAPGNGWTALHNAVAAGDTASAMALIAAGADPTATAKDGRSSLDLARDQGRWRLLHAMLGNTD